jgi:hypothetical protein
MQSVAAPASTGPPPITPILDASQATNEHGRLSLASAIFAISKTPSISKVKVWYGTSKAAEALFNKLPRNVGLETLSGASFAEALQHGITSVPPSELVFIYQGSPLLLIPESLVSAATAVVHLDLHYAQFEELASQTPVNINFAGRYWKTPSYSSSQVSVVARASTLAMDLEMFALHKDAYSVLDMLRQRKIGTPMPSLACTLPLPPAHLTPPMIPWANVKSMIEQVL